MHKRHRRNDGFTLIEVITAVGILSILAAVMLPRFSDLIGNARSAGFNAIQKSYTSAIRLSHSVWMARNIGAAGTITMEGQPIEMNANGWPALDAAIPAQDTATELYDMLMNTPLPSGWTPSQDLGAGTAAYNYSNQTFEYDANTGLVTTLP